MIDVLRDKHPLVMNPDIKVDSWMSFKDYKERTGMLSIKCNQDIVKVIAGKLSICAGPDRLN